VLEKIHIICVECGHSIELDGEVYADYQGPIRCISCKASLGIELDGYQLTKPPVVLEHGSKEK